MGLANRAVFFHLNTLRIVFLVLLGCIITVLTFRACKRYSNAQLRHLLTTNGIENTGISQAGYLIYFSIVAYPCQ